MPDLSDSGIDRLDSLMWAEFSYLEGLDTAGWAIDDQIDYVIELESIRQSLPGMRENQELTSSAGFYATSCMAGILLLAARNDRPLEEKYRCFMGRLEEIPGFLSKAKELMVEFNQVDLIYSIEYMQGAFELIKGYCDILSDSFPQDNGRISTARDRAVLAMRDFTEFLFEKGPDAPQIVPFGEEEYIRNLRSHYLVDISPDSIMALADREFWRADSLVKHYRQSLPMGEESGPGFWDRHIASPPEDSVIAYCQSELASIANFLKSRDILDVPEGMGKVEFLRLSGYINHAGFTSEIFVDAGPLNPNPNGYYYSFFSMLNRLWGDDLPANYINAEFRTDLVKKVIPGLHLLQGYQRTGLSFTRRASQDDMFINGWKNYCRGILIEQGLFGDDPRVQYDYYCDLRAQALGVYCNTGFHTERLSIDSVRAFVIERMGADSSSYRENSSMGGFKPFDNFSDIFGCLLFQGMQESARQREGDKFSLRDFHNKILSEGSISPVLIARKYGW